MDRIAYNIAVSQSNFASASDITYKDAEGVPVGTPSFVIGNILRNIFYPRIRTFALDSFVQNSQRNL